ncbi:MAG: hypothetical protein U0736_16700 [Gemmataceae bacterium]
MLWRTVATRALLVVALYLVTVGPVRSQRADLRVDDGEVEFLKKARPTRDLRTGLFKGSITAEPNNKEHQEAAEIAAKEVVYPLVWEQDKGLRPEAKETAEDRQRRLNRLNSLVEEFDSRLVQMTRFTDRTAAMQQMYCKAMMTAAPEVIQKGKVIAGVNAARMLEQITQRRAQRGVLESEKEWVQAVLPRLADGNGDRLVETCLTLITDPKANAGVQYYLLRCLGNLLALPPQNPPLVKAENQEKAIAAATKLIDRAVAFPKATPRQEVEGYKMLRQQAVRVVATARTPVVGKEQPALTLARVAGADGSLVPAPRITERLEAAVGLARLMNASAKFPDFQPDYAAAQIARFIVDLGLQANPNLDSKPMARVQPWRIAAARMIEALDALQASVKVPYVQDVVKQAIPVLNSLEQNQPSQTNDLADWLSRNPPPSASLFKSNPASVIKPAAPPPAAPAEDKGT